MMRGGGHVGVGPVGTIEAALLVCGCCHWIFTCRALSFGPFQGVSFFSETTYSFQLQFYDSTDPWKIWQYFVLIFNISIKTNGFTDWFAHWLFLTRSPRSRIPSNVWQQLYWCQLGSYPSSLLEAHYVFLHLHQSPLASHQDRAGCVYSQYPLYYLLGTDSACRNEGGYHSIPGWKLTTFLNQLE